ncbi:hypothetical protein BV372_32475 [Nostoc sp. T09]|uniref:hypothetical protein n=1 Tax=Nostoc sp. T09 TaxID=1932621 RepID=UPI000A36DA81|nr:hypothetical protein [Nostoc sp. T09]OUL20936.1 hypothetical protein BV372_32475 [Nostoc sp. T09]
MGKGRRDKVVIGELLMSQDYQNLLEVFTEARSMAQESRIMAEFAQLQAKETWLIAELALLRSKESQMIAELALLRVKQSQNRSKLTDFIQQKAWNC